MSIWYLVLGILLLGCRTKDQTKQEELLDYHVSRNMELSIDANRLQQFGEVKIKNGKLLNVVTLYLDYVPQSYGDKASLPSCFSTLPPGQVIGHVSCSNGVKVQLKASNVEQGCASNPEDKLGIQSPLIGLSQCDQGSLYIFGFSPVLKVDVD